MLQQEDYSALIETLVGDMAPIGALHHVLRFLEERLPFENALVFFQDRAARSFRILVEYRNNSVRQSNAHFRSRIDRTPVGRELFGRDYQEVFITGDIRGHMHVSGEIRQMGYEHVSVAGMLLHVDDADNVLLFMALLSSERDAFDAGHRHILEAMRPVLERATRPFFLSQAESIVLLRPDGETSVSAPDLLRRCPDLAPMMQMVEVAAPTDSTIMIQGATGSGKGLVAETIHLLSPRSRSSFVQVNCAAIPDSLLESELFGFEKGAFTGATASHKGYFEQANQGTLFLDEVGELSLPAQAKLLQVLEKREVARVGGERRIPVDVRLVAATHRDLQRMAAQASFREDLLYRLRVFPVSVPSLAKRKADIPILAEHFYRIMAAKFEGRPIPRLTRDALRSLASLPWPGNVRQLGHVMERAVLMALARGDNPLRFTSDILDGMDEAHPLSAQDIRAALEKSGWRIQGLGGAAQLLGLHPATLRSRMKALGIPLPRQKKREGGAPPPPPRRGR